MPVRYHRTATAVSMIIDKRELSRTKSNYYRALQRARQRPLDVDAYWHAANKLYVYNGRRNALYLGSLPTPADISRFTGWL